MTDGQAAVDPATTNQGEFDHCRARDWGDAVAYFCDPDGNVIALARRLS